MATATFTSMMLLISGVAGAFVLRDRQWLSLQRPPARHATERDERAIARWFAKTALIIGDGGFSIPCILIGCLARWSKRLTGVSGAGAAAIDDR
jgi:hypothetical protein